MYFNSISIEQVRMAQAALKWSNNDLANHSGLGVATIARYLAGQTTENSTKKIRKAFEANGIEFVGDGEHSYGGGEGVRLTTAEIDFSIIEYHLSRILKLYNRGEIKKGFSKKYMSIIHKDALFEHPLEAVEILDSIYLNLEEDMDKLDNNSNNPNHTEEAWDELYELRQSILDEISRYKAIKC